ncbi:MAG: hypothetical protein A2142_07980 [candidate division Zixibacteria bacterium RBG_16_48_11]|nr:MAG: hypothetical protein A2142_07980 [candidate division Zixibacteria bacterium RBG_16_48_11]
MKLVFLADARSIHIQRWIGFFNRQEDKTHLISLEKPEVSVTETMYIQPRSRWDFAKYILANKEIRELVKKINPDIVNAHFVPNYGLIGAGLKVKPLVVSAWGSDILVSAQKSILHRKRASWVLKKADWLTSDSLYLTEEMVKLGADPKKISSFPLGVEEEFVTTATKRLCEKDVFTVVSTRRLEPVYNLDLLIQAIPLVVKQTQKKVKFIIVGEGSRRKKLGEEVIRQGCSDWVEFRGSLKQEELIDLLRSADIYVSTSRSDSTSVSLLEAFASGLVPVVTDIPGNREWVKNGENGYLIPVDRPRVLAETISHICENFSELQKFVDHNMRLVREKTGYQNNLNILREKFLELMEQKKFGQDG